MTLAMREILESLHDLVVSHENDIEKVGDKFFKEFKEMRKTEIEVAKNLINQIENLL